MTDEIIVDNFARCGNAVTPPVPAALVRANLKEMCGGDLENE